MENYLTVDKFKEDRKEGKENKLSVKNNGIRQDILTSLKIVMQQ